MCEEILSIGHIRCNSRSMSWDGRTDEPDAVLFSPFCCCLLFARCSESTSALAFCPVMLSAALSTVAYVALTLHKPRARRRLADQTRSKKKIDPASTGDHATSAFFEMRNESFPQAGKNRYYTVYTFMSPLKRLSCAITPLDGVLGEDLFCVFSHFKA